VQSAVCPFHTGVRISGWNGLLSVVWLAVYIFGTTEHLCLHPLPLPLVGARGTQTKQLSRKVYVAQQLDLGSPERVFRQTHAARLQKGRGGYTLEHTWAWDETGLPSVANDQANTVWRLTYGRNRFAPK